MGKKKSVFKQKFKKGAKILESSIEDVIKRRIKHESEVIEHEDYDDDSYSITVKVYYK